MSDISSLILLSIQLVLLSVLAQAVLVAVICSTSTIEIKVGTSVSFGQGLAETNKWLGKTRVCKVSAHSWGDKYWVGQTPASIQDYASIKQQRLSDPLRGEEICRSEKQNGPQTAC